MNPRPSDVNEGIKLTQKYLSAAVKSHEKPDGTASQFTLPGLDAHVTINACYIGGSGQHRAWKYLYYLTINGRKFGGHDRRDSFVAWAVNKINESASGDGSMPSPAVTRDCPNSGRDLSATSSAAILDVAPQGVAGVGGTVEGHGGGSTWAALSAELEFHPISEYQVSPADSQIPYDFTDNITRYVDKVLGREPELAEVGQ